MNVNEKLPSNEPVVPEEAIENAKAKSSGSTQGEKLRESTSSKGVERVQNQVFGKTSSSTGAGKDILGHAKRETGIISRQTTQARDTKAEVLSQQKWNIKCHPAFNKSYPTRVAAEKDLVEGAKLFQREGVKGVVKLKEKINELQPMILDRTRVLRDLTESRDLYWKDTPSNNQIRAGYDEKIKEKTAELKSLTTQVKRAEKQLDRVKSQPVMTYVIRNRTSEIPNDNNLHYVFSMCTMDKKQEVKINHCVLDYNVEEGTWTLTHPDGKQPFVGDTPNTVIETALQEVGGNRERKHMGQPMMWR